MISGPANAPGRCPRSSPRVSIGLPVYNGARFLANTLEWLLSQTYEDFELIISDNASTDKTEEICRDFAARDRRISYYRNRSNLGAAWNYNRVLEVSRGGYFKWASADDLCAPELLQRCVERLDQDPQCVLCYCKARIIDEQGQILRNHQDGMDAQCSRPSRRFILVTESMGLCNPVFGLIRAQVLKRTRAIGNYIGSDTCLLTELSLYGRFVEIPQYLFLRRLRPDARSYYANVQKQLEFYDPARTRRIVLPNWRMRWENFRSVLRSPIPLVEKAVILRYLLRRMVQARHAYAAECQTAVKQALWAQR